MGRGLTNMPTSFPFLTVYDPPGTSEGTLDPLGLYQIADQLAVQLVPAVRERMRRVRFLTAMAVGSLVTEGLEDNPTHRDASPYLVWEWLIVESIVRQMPDEEDIGGVAGRHMARRAIDQHGYLDARSYLKTPRIFGFHGIYKRLAVYLGVVDVHLGPGPNGEKLADAWARGLGLSGFNEAKQIMSRWRAAVRRSLDENPPRTKPGWTGEAWAELARAFAPANALTREKRFLEELLLQSKERPLGALPAIWQLQERYDDENFSEEDLHNRLEKRQPNYGPLLDAIRGYESFARSLQDAFDVLKAEAATRDAQGFVVTTIASDTDFKRSVSGLHKRFETAYRALGEVVLTKFSLQNLFFERFEAFSEPLDPGACAAALCEHHLKVQRGKSSDGKRPWFDRLGADRIYIRHRYREPRRHVAPGRYLHEYRGRPIGRFRTDLS
jgi:hypothetical protein